MNKRLLPIYRPEDSGLAKTIQQGLIEHGFSAFAGVEPWGVEMPSIDEKTAAETQFAFVLLSEKDGSYDAVQTQVFRACSFGLYIVAVYRGDPDNYPDEVGYAARLFIDCNDKRLYTLLDRFYSWVRFDHPWRPKPLNASEFDYPFYERHRFAMPQKNQADLTIFYGAVMNGSISNSVKLDDLPHLWVYGKPGSGKWDWVRLNVLALLRQNDPSMVRFVFFDPKRKMTYFERLRSLFAPIAHEQQELWDTIYLLEGEMHRRLELIDQAVGMGTIADYNAQHEGKLPYIVVLVDELQAARMSDGVRIVSQFGRDVGIHFIVISETDDDSEIAFAHRVEFTSAFDPILIRTDGKKDPVSAHRYSLSDGAFLEGIKPFLKEV